jgi:hypothetical protein
MKYVKMLGLAAVAAAALMAFVGAGTASATELYSTGTTVNAGTVLKGSLEPETTATLSTTDESSIVDTCTGSTLEGPVDTYTGGDATGTITTLGWSGCSFTTDTLTSGSLSINSSGTVSGKGSVVTVNIGVSCRYGTGEGTTLGTLNTGTVSINAVINEQAPKQFLCPDTTKWVAKYLVTSPHDLTAK